MNNNELTLEELKNLHNLYLRKAYSVDKDAKRQYNIAHKSKYTKEEINEYQRKKYKERKEKAAQKAKELAALE
jgi:hypothetical protein